MLVSLRLGRFLNDVFWGMTAVTKCRASLRHSVQSAAKAESTPNARNVTPVTVTECLPSIERGSRYPFPVGDPSSKRRVPRRTERNVITFARRVIYFIKISAYRVTFGFAKHFGRHDSHVRAGTLR